MNKPLPFRKMNGLGNAFAIIDVRGGGWVPDDAQIAALASARSGIGFDQFIVIAPPPEDDEHADATMRIMNADGGEVEACGNAARCVTRILLEETEGRDEVHLASTGGSMRGWREGDIIAVDMGVPRFDAAAIPLAPGAGDPLALQVPGHTSLGRAACCNVGNPHAVFFVADTDLIPLELLGPALERNSVFPERANITFATIESPSHVTARVWERGVGPTKACGTAACATLAVGHKLGRLADEADIDLPGGKLRIAMRDGRLVMQGPTSFEWHGVITHEGFERQRF